MACPVIQSTNLIFKFWVFNKTLLLNCLFVQPLNFIRCSWRLCVAGARNSSVRLPACLPSYSYVILLRPVIFFVLSVLPVRLLSHSRAFALRAGERDGHFVHRASMAAAAVLGESRFEDKYKLNANPTQEELDEKKQKKEEWKKKKAARREKRKKKRAGKDGR